MAKRPAIPKNIETELLTKSRRRCCLCFHLEMHDRLRKGQIAHLDGDRSNNKLDNLAWLCLRHHDAYDTKPSQSKGFTVKEVKHYRKELYAHIARKIPVSNRLISTTHKEKQSRTKQPIILPGTYSTYRQMLHDPAIESGRAYLADVISRCKWHVSYGETFAPASRLVIDQNIQQIMPDVIQDSLSALDFGWCGFEVIWQMRFNYAHVSLKWLEPEMTKILIDSHGEFAGLKQDGVDLLKDKSLCVTVRTARSSPANLYGFSYLERVRELWSMIGPSNEFRQIIYDSYLGNLDSPQWFTLTIKPYLFGLQKSLNELFSELIAYNFGPSRDNWARVSFEAP